MGILVSNSWQECMTIVDAIKELINEKNFLLGVMEC